MCAIEWYPFIHDYKFICSVLLILSKGLSRTSLALCVHKNLFLQLRTKSSLLYSEYKMRHEHTHQAYFQNWKGREHQEVFISERVQKTFSLCNSSLWQFGLMSYLSWCSYIEHFLSCPLSCLSSSLSCPEWNIRAHYPDANCVKLFSSFFPIVNKCEDCLINWIS